MTGPVLLRTDFDTFQKPWFWLPFFHTGSLSVPRPRARRSPFHVRCTILAGVWFQVIFGVGNGRVWRATVVLDHGLHLLWACAISIPLDALFNSIHLDHTKSSFSPPFSAEPSPTDLYRSDMSRRRLGMMAFTIERTARKPVPSPSVASSIFSEPR